MELNLRAVINRRSIRRPVFGVQLERVDNMVLTLAN